MYVSGLDQRTLKTLSPTVVCVSVQSFFKVLFLFMYNKFDLTYMYMTLYTLLFSLFIIMNLINVIKGIK